MGTRIFCDICKRDLDAKEELFDVVVRNRDLNAYLAWCYGDVCPRCKTAIQAFISSLGNTTVTVAEGKPLSGEISQPGEGIMLVSWPADGDPVITHHDLTKDSPPPVEKEKKARGKRKANATVADGDGAPADGEGCDGCDVIFGVCSGADLCASEASGEGEEEGSDTLICPKLIAEIVEGSTVHQTDVPHDGMDITISGTVLAVRSDFTVVVNWHYPDGDSSEELPMLHFCGDSCPLWGQGDCKGKAYPEGHVPAPVVSFDEEVPPNMIEEESCETCRGVGEVTVQSGQTPETYEEKNVPCPDCSTTDLSANIDKDRRCCMPSDRDITSDGDIRILYCRECGLIHKKEDTTETPWKRIDFIVGEKVDLEKIRGAQG